MSAHAIRHALPLAAMLALALPGQPAAGQALSAPAAGEWVRLVTRDGASHEGRLTSGQHQDLIGTVIGAASVRQAWVPADLPGRVTVGVSPAGAVGLALRVPLPIGH